MNRLLLASLGLLCAGGMAAQSSMDAFRYSQSDLKGTARFMGMAGAFGALGGDLSTLSQNPAGIGVYRNSEIGLTMSLDMQSAKSTTNLGDFKTDQTKFLFNNIGGVWTMKFKSSVMPNINLGFTYNRAASFNRRYKGTSRLSNSVSNYMADLANDAGLVEDQLSVSNGDPWLSGAPWLSVLGFQSYCIYPTYMTDSQYEVPYWEGQWEHGQTSGIGMFDVEESGYVDEYNIALGGNISNVVSWGMDFGITYMSYKENSTWSEQLDNAWVNGVLSPTSDFSLGNRYSAYGTGFTYRLGVIVKPIQELRIGLAVQTPTWYRLSESFIGGMLFNNPDRNNALQEVQTNNGLNGSNTFNFRAPMKLTASVAGVIANRFIISADYEWQPYTQMQFSSASNYSYGYNPWYDDYYWPDVWGSPWNRPSPESPDTRAGMFESSPFANTNSDIKDDFRSQNTLRLGAEFRVTPRFSVRAGYSFVSSPVTPKAYNNEIQIFPAGTMTNFRLNDVTNYITCGLGYKISLFYVDLAYVYKHTKAAFRPYPTNASGTSSTTPFADLGLSNHQLVLSMGFKL